MAVYRGRGWVLNIHSTLHMMYKYVVMNTMNNCQNIFLGSLSDCGLSYISYAIYITIVKLTIYGNSSVVNFYNIK